MPGKDDIHPQVWKASEGRMANRPAEPIGGQSEELFREACRSIVGGVNSPSRSFAAVGGGAPRFIVRGEGAYLWDADGRRYIDYLAAFGAIILGHAHPRVVEAAHKAAQAGSVFGAPTPGEVALATKIRSAIPFIEKVRFTVSGTEAVMTALRLARAYTGREKILKFDGSYHGHSDAVLISAGSGSSTLGIDESLGVTAGVRADVISIPFNDTDALRAAVERWGLEIACVLIEPIVGNFGIVPPQPGFLQTVSELARSCGALVIWDEVITAFRFRYGSASELFGVEPDLATLGKLIGGGFPIGAYGGRADVMEQMAPLGAVYQDGTLAGNPVSMAAGLACLTELEESAPYERISRFAGRLAEAVRSAAAERGVPVQVNQFGGALSVHFTGQPVQDFASCEAGDDRLFSRFFQEMLARGIFLAPSIYEAWFVTAAHTEEDIAETEAAIAEAMAAL